MWSSSDGVFLIYRLSLQQQPADLRKQVIADSTELTAGRGRYIRRFRLAKTVFVTLLLPRRSPRHTRGETPRARTLLIFQEAILSEVEVMARI